MLFAHTRPGRPETDWEPRTAPARRRAPGEVQGYGTAEMVASENKLRARVYKSTARRHLESETQNFKQFVYSVQRILQSA